MNWVDLPGVSGFFFLFYYLFILFYFISISCYDYTIRIFGHQGVLFLSLGLTITLMRAVGVLIEQFKKRGYLIYYSFVSFLLFVLVYTFFAFCNVAYEVGELLIC